LSVESDFNSLFPKEITLSNEKKDIGLSKSEINKIYKNYINENYNEEVIRYKKTQCEGCANLFDFTHCKQKGCDPLKANLQFFFFIRDW